MTGTANVVIVKYVSSGLVQLVEVPLVESVRAGMYISLKVKPDVVPSKKLKSSTIALALCDSFYVSTTSEEFISLKAALRTGMVLADVVGYYTYREFEPNPPDFVVEEEGEAADELSTSNQ